MFVHILSNLAIGVLKCTFDLWTSRPASRCEGNVCQPSRSTKDNLIPRTSKYREGGSGISSTCISLMHCAAAIPNHDHEPSPKSHDEQIMNLINPMTRTCSITLLRYVNNFYFDEIKHIGWLFHKSATVKSKAIRKQWIREQDQVRRDHRDYLVSGLHYNYMHDLDRLQCFTYLYDMANQPFVLDKPPTIKQFWHI